MMIFHGVHGQIVVGQVLGEDINYVRKMSVANNQLGVISLVSKYIQSISK
jgi:hypothetical protein